MSELEIVFTWRFRTRYAECDVQGVVFNARFLDYTNVILTEFWRSRNVSIIGEGAFETLVAKVSIDYHRPIRIDEEIDGCVHIKRVGRSSMTWLIALHGRDGGMPRAVIEITCVHVDLKSGRSQPLPDAIKAALAGKARELSSL